jgi:hypothetical protein
MIIEVPNVYIAHPCNIELSFPLMLKPSFYLQHVKAPLSFLSHIQALTYSLWHAQVLTFSCIQAQYIQSFF